MDEVQAVFEYIKRLLLLEEKGRKVIQTDIGVIVPYKLQSKIIKRICNNMKLDDITVGTPEAFQGQEKLIMIVTTVRTDGFVGFLNDPRVHLLYCVIINLGSIVFFVVI